MTSSAKTYASRLKANRCTSCGRDKGTATTVTCLDCREAQRKAETALRQSRRAASLCTRCGEPAVPGKAKCSAHTTYASAHAKKFRSRRVGSGLCLVCGDNALPTLVNSAQCLCEMCYFKKKAYRHLGSRKHWIALKDQLERQNWKCAYTGEPIIIGINDSVDHKLPQMTHPHLAKDPANVEWTTRIINTMKRAMTSDDFISLAQRVASYHGA